MKAMVAVGLMLCSISGVAQNRIVERHQRTENGVTKGWTITKEIDASGNVLSYDSTYFENDGNSSGNETDFNHDFRMEQFDFSDSTAIPGFDFHFHSTPESGFNFQFGDSLMFHSFPGQSFNFEELMKPHQQMMDEFFRNYQPVQPSDEGKKKKAKGERI